jgi:hypothetical protein
LDTITKILKPKVASSVDVDAQQAAQAAAARIDQLQATVSDLQRYKNEHEAEKWPALTDEQKKDWAAELAKYSGLAWGGHPKQIEIINLDSRGELLVESLEEVFMVADLGNARVFNTGWRSGLSIESNPKEMGETVKRLLEKLGYNVPPVTLAGDQTLRIYIGKRVLALKRPPVGNASGDTNSSDGSR